MKEKNGSVNSRVESKICPIIILKSAQQKVYNLHNSIKSDILGLSNRAIYELYKEIS
jgi:hypothetical protein